MWKLVIEDDEGKRTSVPLTRDQYTVGRKDGNTIRLTERNVSRDHARLSKKAANGAATTGGRAVYVLEDLASYNGVFVNGLRMTHTQDLAHGDLVQIGDYRIVLQDEMVLEGTTPTVADEVKASAAQGTGSRAATLLDRPNRFVVLAGPAPGTEFPLDRERMTIGRAEDANISVNHNSVSRLHCEVHSLGDGRFEIVDKGSSNGVRVNGADLRRGIVEPGDVIELGDVKFKFIGAGQIFRPTESQQLAILNDRAASEIVRGKRAGTALPVAIFGVVVAAGAMGAWVYTRPHAQSGLSMASVAATQTPDGEALRQAERLCGAGDCDAAHDKLQTIADGSPVRSSSEYRDLEARWADQMLIRGDTEADISKKRALYQRVAQELAVDPGHRRTAADKLQTLDAIAAVPAATTSFQAVASTKPDSAEPSAVTPASRPDAGHRIAQMMAEPATLPASAVAASPTPSPSPLPTPRSTGGASVDERERALALGDEASKRALKSQLEQKVYTNHATDQEINLLISTCKDLSDKLCVSQARKIKADRQNQ